MSSPDLSSPVLKRAAVELRQFADASPPTMLTRLRVIASLLDDLATEKESTPLPAGQLAAAQAMRNAIVETADTADGQDRMWLAAQAWDRATAAAPEAHNGADLAICGCMMYAWASGLGEYVNGHHPNCLYVRQQETTAAAPEDEAHTERLLQAHLRRQRESAAAPEGEPASTLCDEVGPMDCVCALPKGHALPHRDAEVPVSWPRLEPTPTAPPAAPSAAFVEAIDRAIEVLTPPQDPGTMWDSWRIIEARERLAYARANPPPQAAAPAAGSELVKHYVVWADGKYTETWLPEGGAQWRQNQDGTRTHGHVVTVKAHLPLPPPLPEVPTVCAEARASGEGER